MMSGAATCNHEGTIMKSLFVQDCRKNTPDEKEDPRALDDLSELPNLHITWDGRETFFYIHFGTY